ncbi:MAG: hypothetical protein RL733_464, partial [Actinomycetota bacterium]
EIEFLKGREVISNTHPEVEIISLLKA